MNIIASSEIPINIPKGKEPVAAYIERLSQALRSEQEAVNEYTAILQEPSLPQEVRDTVTEIIEDEKDHMVLIAALLSEEIQTAFPNNTDELKEKEVVKEAVEGDSISVSIERISSDSLAGNTTWLVHSDVKVAEAVEEDIENVLNVVNDANEEEVELVELSEDGLVTKMTSDKQLTIGRAKEILNDIVKQCDEIM